MSGVHFRTIPSTDGVTLGATLFEPPSPASDASVVLLSSATGVRRAFYARFAQFLADAGCIVLTYDYRGIGDSRPATLRGFRARMRDWGTCDLAGMIAWIDDAFCGSRLVLVGHSVGGQLLGLAPNAGRVSAMLAVGVASGWWGFWPRPRRYANALFWKIVVPGLTNTLGYFPSRALGLGQDLPAGVAREWARWCRSPAYMINDDGTPLRPFFDRFTGDLLSLSIADDQYVPREAVEAFAAWYSSAVVRTEPLDPRSLGLRSLGHFGFFRESSRTVLWPEAVSWIRAPSARSFAPAQPSFVGRIPTGL